MISMFINDQEVFKQCLKVYMNKFAYKNTKTEDLLTIMTEVSGKDTL